MPSLKDLRNRIASVKATQKITKAMLIVCTAERGLCGAFNSSIARLARDHANRLLAEGKTVKIICVGKKGYDILRRQFGDQIIDFVDLRGARTLGFEHADLVAQKVLQ